MTHIFFFSDWNGANKHGPLRPIRKLSCGYWCFTLNTTDEFLAGPHVGGKTGSGARAGNPVGGELIPWEVILQCSSRLGRLVWPLFGMLPTTATKIEIFASHHLAWETHCQYLGSQDAIDLAEAGDLSEALNKLTAAICIGPASKERAQRSKAWCSHIACTEYRKVRRLSMSTNNLHSSTFDEYRYPASRSCRLDAVDPQEWKTLVHNTSMLPAMTKTRAPSLCDKIFRALRYTFQTSHVIISILTLLVQSEMFLSFCLVGDPKRGRSSSLMYCRRAEVLLRRSWSTHCSLAKAVNPQNLP